MGRREYNSISCLRDAPTHGAIAVSLSLSLSRLVVSASACVETREEAHAVQCTG